MAKFAIIASEKDIAGMNYKKIFLDELGFKPEKEKYSGNEIYSRKNDNAILVTVKTETIDCENIDNEINADYFIFASRHSSSDKRPIFSCHTPGNWGKPGVYMGGKENKICTSHAFLLKTAYNLLKKNNKPELGKNGELFDVTLECTHHGPYLIKPTLFIEVGSTEKQWNNMDACRVVAQTVIELIKKTNEEENNLNNIMSENNGQKEKKTAFGIGGTHYCSAFNKIMEKTDIAVGHICPKYAIHCLDRHMIEEALLKTKPKAELVLLDWKGMGSEKERIVGILDEMKVDYKKIKDVR